MTELKTVDDISEEEYLRDHMVPHSLTPSPKAENASATGRGLDMSAAVTSVTITLSVFPDAMSMISKGG